MHLLDRLRAVAGKLGLVQVAAAAPAAPQKIETHAVNLDQLAARVREDEVRTLAEQPVDAAPDFASIFAAAGVQPPAHGWTIERLRAMVASEPRLRGLTGEPLQRALLAQLLDAGVDAADLVRDAVARDQALDAFEACATEKLAARRLIRGRRLAEIETQLAALQQERAKTQSEADADEARWKAWKAGKTAYEREMIRLIGCFVDTTVITTE